MGYKILGYAVWNGAKWYLGLRYGRLARSQKLALAGAAAVAVAGVGTAAVLRSGD